MKGKNVGKSVMIITVVIIMLTERDKELMRGMRGLGIGVGMIREKEDRK